MTDNSNQEADSSSESEGWVPVEDRTDDSPAEPAQPFGSITGNDEESAVSDSTTGDDDGLYPLAPGRGSTSGDAPTPVGGEEGTDPLGSETDVPRYARVLGDIGIYLGVAAVVLTVGGLLLAVGGVQPYASVALTFSLLIVFVAMLLGIVFQAHVTDISLSR
jgi:hypothetical protein